MKKLLTSICLCIVAAAAARADTALTIPAQYGCLFDLGSVVNIPNPPTQTGMFNINGASGQGSLKSQVPSYWDEDFVTSHSYIYSYNYTIDLSALSAPTSHCIKLQIHFGTPAGCFNPGVAGDPGQIQSATLNPWGDVTFVFNGGCLGLGQPAVSFSMVSAAGYKTNFVTVTDDYVDPASGLTNEVKINVPAIVPDIPPDPPPWVIAYYYSRENPLSVSFQGDLNLVSTNEVNSNAPPVQANGRYDFAVQLQMTETNGPVVSPVTTQTVSVVNGLFTIPLPGDPTAFGDGSVRYVRIGVRPSGSSGNFSQLVPAVRVAPTAQALYALTAGSVADIAPDQAVTSLNGFTGGVKLQAGSGISITSDGSQTLTISAQPGVVSDRSVKTDFAPLNAGDVLAKLARLPIQQWRYTNEVAGVRHLGPMAQDFRSVFGFGNNDKFIPFVDEEGVALAAIKGLNEKVVNRSQREEAEIEKLEAENAELKQQNDSLEMRMEKIEKLIRGKEANVIR